MAKSESVIRAEYKKTIQQAEALEKLASDLRQIAADPFAACLTEIRHGWKGDCADACLKKGGRMQEDIREQARELDQAAQLLRRVAKDTRKSESRSL